MSRKDLIIGVVCLSLTACHQPTESETAWVRPVKTALATGENIVSKEYAGMVEAAQYVTLSFPISGRIEQLPINEGQQVKRGQLIAAIDSRNYSLQAEADKAAYQAAQSRLERNRRLLQQEAIARQEVEMSLAEYERARSAYEVSQTLLADTRLYAPFEGTIERRNVEKYQRVEVGQAVAVLVNTDKLRIAITIPDAYLYLLKTPKQTYSVTFDTYPDMHFNARVTEVMEISTFSTGIPVTLVIDDADFNLQRYQIKPGFTCRVNQSTDIAPLLDEPFVHVPLSAVFSDTNNRRTYVWVVDDGHVHLREVKLYNSSGNDEALIQSGLRVGERVVTAGVYQLTEGEKVSELVS